jgi:hypothetical protein
VRFIRSYAVEVADVACELSDERLLAHSALPIIDRLRRLEERQFTLAVRVAPGAARQSESGTEAMR